MLPVHEHLQTVDPRLGHYDDAPSAPAVAAVGSTAGDVLLAPEADAPVTSLTGFDFNGDTIDEHEASQWAIDGGTMDVTVGRNE
jgi:hypothetical protein